jgi:hypothetical protein
MPADIILFPEEKKVWRKQFIENVQKILNDNVRLTDAINTRGSLRRQDSKKLSPDELTAALEAIDKKDTSTYFVYDWPRIQHALTSCGFSEEEVASMQPSQILAITSVLFVAADDGILTNVNKSGAIEAGPQFQAYESAVRSEELLKIMQVEDIRRDSGNFTKELPLLAKPLIQQYLSQYQSRSGLALLSDTLIPDTPNTKALRHTLIAMDKGTLTVNGQLPDQNYVLGEYLIHGGRVKFDTSDLSPEEQTTFFKFITNGQAQSRAYATHRVAGFDANGSPAETKSGIAGFLADTFKAIIGSSPHAGINLAIGGSHRVNMEGNKDSLGLLPDESGSWGHLYLHKARDLVLLGIESSAPSTTNIRTQEGHSTLGASGDLSPFLEKKINTKALHDSQALDGKTRLSTEDKYNWATVKVSKAQLAAMLKTAEQENNCTDLVSKIPDNATQAETHREAKMNAWAKATTQANKPSTLGMVIGSLLITLGVIIAAIPIPIIAQTIGSGLFALGIGIATGLAGLATFFGATRSEPEKAKSLYQKYLEELKPEEESPQTKPTHESSSTAKILKQTVEDAKHAPSPPPPSSTTLTSSDDDTEQTVKTLPTTSPDSDVRKESLLASDDDDDDDDDYHTPTQQSPS